MSDGTRPTAPSAETASDAAKPRAGDDTHTHEHTRAPQTSRKTTALRRFAVLMFFITLAVVSVINQILAAIALYRTATDPKNLTPMIITIVLCAVAVIVGVSLYLALAAPYAARNSLVDRTYRALGVSM